MVLSDAQLAMFQNTNMYHYVNYYPDPDRRCDSIMTDAQLINADGRDVTDTEIKPGLTRVQAQIGDENNEVDGEFTITFNTNLNEPIDANAVLHASLNAIASEETIDAIATATTAAEN